MIFADRPAPSTSPVRAPLADAITNTIGMKLKLIKAGKFKMGSPDSEKDAQDDEKPQHEVEIMRPFYLGVIRSRRGSSPPSSATPTIGRRRSGRAIKNLAQSELFVHRRRTTTRWYVCRGTTR